MCDKNRGGAWETAVMLCDTSAHLHITWGDVFNAFNVQFNPIFIYFTTDTEIEDQMDLKNPTPCIIHPSCAIPQVGNGKGEKEIKTSTEEIKKQFDITIII